MSPGESKTVIIPPEKAYGRYREDRVIKIDKKDLPEEIVPAEGMTLEVCAPNDVMVPVQITEIEGSTVTLDKARGYSEKPRSRRSIKERDESLAKEKAVTGKSPVC